MSDLTMYCALCKEAGHATSWHQTRIVELEQALAHERGLREVAEAERVAQVERLEPFLSGWEHPDVKIVELEAALKAAEAEVKRAAETYVVALDVSEQHWRKQCEAAEASAKNDHEVMKGVIFDLEAKLEAAEAERETWIDDCNKALIYLKEARAQRDNLRAYASRLLAAFIQQRQALEALRDEQNGPPLSRQKDVDSWTRAYEQVNDLLAADHAALLAEGAALGVEP